VTQRGCVEFYEVDDFPRGEARVRTEIPQKSAEARDVRECALVTLVEERRHVVPARLSRHGGSCLVLVIVHRESEPFRHQRYDHRQTGGGHHLFAALLGGAGVEPALHGLSLLTRRSLSPDGR
jgi:hypothetical protein